MDDLRGVEPSTPGRRRVRPEAAGQGKRRLHRFVLAEHRRAVPFGGKLRRVALEEVERPDAAQPRAALHLGIRTRPGPRLHPLRQSRAFDARKRLCRRVGHSLRYCLGAAHRPAERHRRRTSRLRLGLGADGRRGLRLRPFARPAALHRARRRAHDLGHRRPARHTPQTFMPVSGVSSER